VAEQFSRLEPPLLTCEAVLAEADHLVRRTDRPAGVVMDLLNRGVLAVGIDLKIEAGSVARIQAKYGDRSASVADACLVRMSEIYDGSRVLTFDSDFRIYRRHGRRVIPLLTPAE
jgi:predicted nucleic acid-binding protein